MQPAVTRSGVLLPVPDAMSFRLLVSTILLTAPLVLPGQRPVNPAELLSPPPSEWLSYGRTYDNQRFSPLTQVNRQTVRQLAPTAVYQMNVQRADGLEATPLVAGGVMFMTTSHNSVLAFDLRTHKRLWQYNHERNPKAAFCC